METHNADRMFVAPVCCQIGPRRVLLREMPLIKIDFKNFEYSSEPSEKSKYCVVCNVPLLTNSITSGRNTLTSSTNIKDCNLGKK